MNMHALDWWIVAALFTVLAIGACSTVGYTRSVGAFLVANRCGGRYLISMSNAMAGMGVITLVGLFEQNFKVGYTSMWWGALTEPVLIMLALSGWVVYRFRQTRAMTLAQFFEIRYSRRFRIFAGAVAFAAGLVNFGIFPAVGARFFMALCGLPEHVGVAGMEMPLLPMLMAGLLGSSLAFTMLGGQIAVMVTDFLQGVFTNVVFLVVIIFVLLLFGWDSIGSALTAAPPGQSMLNPFDLGAESDFNPWFFVISAVIIFYGPLTWQGAAGYNYCAKTPHEAKMVGVLNGWRYRVLLLITIMVPVGVHVMLADPGYAAEAAAVNDALATHSETMQHQLRAPTALGVLLPRGLLGLLCAAMLAAFITTHDTYLHSWGSILVQDVILPLRGKPFSPKVHLWTLRGAMAGVAVFIFGFSLLFQQADYILMFLAITGAIFFGGAGSVIIGGLYWKRGTTAAAWSAMGTGMTLSVFGTWVTNRPEPFPLTGQEMTLVAIACSVVAYVLVSLLGPRRDFDMDRLLHRGVHAVGGETSVNYDEARTWLERLGIDREFTGWDRVVACVSVGWPVAWTLIFLGGTIWHVTVGIPDAVWLPFWHGWTWVVLCTAVAITAWFSIGGFRDLVWMFRNLRGRDNPAEDGRVEDHRSMGET
jgi:SSS family solute:Na+ symporter